MNEDFNTLGCMYIMVVRKLATQSSSKSTKKTNTHNDDKIPSIEDQIEESLANIASGNYKEYEVDEYIKELKTRFIGDELEDSRTT